MKRRPVTNRFCRNPDCSLYGQPGAGNIIRHGFFRVKGQRRSCSIRGLIGYPARQAGLGKLAEKTAVFLPAEDRLLQTLMIAGII